MIETSRLLPANEEAERAILGAILLDNKAYNETSKRLSPEDFSLDSHRRIYSRMTDLGQVFAADRHDHVGR